MLERITKSIYLASLNCKDAFGSITYRIVEHNLTKFRIPWNLVDHIMDLCKDFSVRIWNIGPVPNPICIRKGVRPRYPLSPLLFNICIDYLFTYIKRNENQ
jgi:hypothetical protein